MQPLRRGAHGVAVAEVRTLLAGLGLLNNTDPTAAHRYDGDVELAVRHFQQRRHISVDGIVGAETYAALQGAHWQLGDRALAHEAGQPNVGDDVLALQTQLIELGYNIPRADGVFGPLTAEGLRNFQRDYGLVPDGICGPETLRALHQLSRRVVGGRPQLLRELVAVAASGPNLLGKRIVIDPGHGGDDPGVRYEEITEAELVWDLARRLEGRLSALGVRTWMTRGPGNGRTNQERAELANEVGADLVLSLHIDSIASTQAHGLATFHFGTASGSSTVGERLADLIGRELCARTGMVNCGYHGKSWALLRLTRMPTVRVELGYLSSPIDRARLVDPLFRDTVAEGLLVAVQRLYLPSSDDPPTGVMRLAAS